jgi:ribosomal protein L37AE/L43A
MQANHFQPKAVIEHIDPRILAMGEPWYLFNIYDMEHTRPVSTWGTYFIPACPEGEPWVRSASVIPGTYQENYAKFTDKEEYPARAIPGEDIVKAVLALESPLENITRFGVFASHNETPTKKELEQANKKLETFLIAQVQEADQWSTSVDGIERQSIGAHHWKAARRLRVTRPWMNEAEALDSCPFCDKPVKRGVPKCSHCHEVIDAAAYAALKAKIGAV